MHLVRHTRSRVAPPGANVRHNDRADNPEVRQATPRRARRIARQAPTVKGWPDVASDDVLGP